MFQTMLIATFCLGAICVIGPVVVVLFRRFTGKGGIELKIGKVEVSTPNTAIAFAIGGVVLIYMSISSTAALAAKNDQLMQATKISAAVTKVSMDANQTVTPVQAAQFSELQDQTFAMIREFAKTRDLALFVLQQLSKNTFGLVAVSKANSQHFSALLGDVKEKFGDDYRVQIELAKGYRSLYESTRDSSFLDQAYVTAKAVVDSGAGSGEERFTANQLLGVVQHARHESAAALKSYDEAAKTAPNDERYKLEFNYCLALYSLERNEDAVMRCDRASEMAQATGVDFWQPAFMKALVHLRQDRKEDAVSAFVDCRTIANRGHESDLLDKYIAAQEAPRSLCSDDRFAGAFAEYCTAGETENSSLES